MNFSEYTFGFADANTEFLRIENYFDNVFYDPQDNLKNIIDGWPFIVVGRKGVGKSAYCAKIRSLQNERFFTSYLPLNEFEYSTFEKTSTDKNVTGTQKFIHSWNFLLLSLIFKSLKNEMNITESESLDNVVSTLEKLGFSIDFNYKQFVTTLSKIKTGVNLKIFDVSYEHEFGNKPDNYLNRISTINDYMMNNLKDIYLGDSKLLLLIDGVDDVLRFKKNRTEILNSLIRSIDYLNNSFTKNKINIKIVIFIREEIFSLLNDTDMNKIKRDSSIKIDWYNNTDALKQIVKLRMIFSGISPDKVENEFANLFPKNIKNKPVWDYLLEFTLYKPRDIIQFFKCCQELYGIKNKLSYSEVKETIKYYSNQYFIEEMKNGLSGFVNDELISVIPSVLTKISTNSFTLEDFMLKINQQLPSKELDKSDIKLLLFTLYETGFIGQLIITGKGKYSKKSVQFKYRNPYSTLDYNNTFIVHRGITVGLGIKI